MVYPSSLYASEIHLLPPALVDAYKSELSSRGLLDKAREPLSSGGFHGGESKEETELHFAMRFGNSCSRVEACLLDVDERCGKVPRRLMASLVSGGTISWLDLACGAGAASLALLTTLAELRQAGVSTPIDTTIRIIGADCSPVALEIFEGLLERLRPVLSAQLLAVELETVVWDASDKLECVRLGGRWLSDNGANENWMIISNVSGMKISAFNEKMSWAVRHLSERALATPTVTLWLEPGNRSAKKFIARAVGALTSPIAKYLDFLGVAEPDGLSWDYHWRCPVRLNNVPSGVSVRAFEVNYP